MTEYNSITSNAYYNKLDADKLSRLNQLLNSIEADEVEFDTTIDSSARDLGIQFEHTNKEIDKISAKLKNALKEREKAIKELEDLLRENNLMIKDEENEAYIRYIRSRVLLDKHVNAVKYLGVIKKQSNRNDSIIYKTKDVLSIMKMLYIKKEFEKAVNKIPELKEFSRTHDMNSVLADKELLEMTKIIAKYQIHTMSDKDKKIYDKAKDM